jgi:hypothetical protein
MQYDIASDLNILPSTYTPGNHQKGKVSRCNLHFAGIPQYGKKHALLGFTKRPQDVVARRSSPQPRFKQSIDKALCFGFIFVWHFLYKTLG